MNKKVLWLFFAASFICAGFMLCLFNILRFYFFPVNIGINMLLIGFPIGGIIALSGFKLSIKDFIKSLAIVKWAMLFTLLICFAYPHFSYVRALQPSQSINFYLMVRETVLVILIFLPYFISYGIMEFVGYRAGKRLFPQGFSLIYASFLGGAAAAYAFIYFLLPVLGLVRILLLIFSAIMLLSRLKKPGLIFKIYFFLLVLLLFFPQADAKIMNALEGNFPLSVQSLRREGDKEICRKWTRNGYFALTYNQVNKSLKGFFNNYLFWSFEKNNPNFPLERIPFSLLLPNPKVSIIGSGGGRQVFLALQNNPRKVTAIDIDAEVLDLLRTKFKNYVEEVYNNSKVEISKMNGRIFHEANTDKYDLIYLAAAGGSPYALSNFLEPSFSLHTIEGFSVFKNRLEKSGLIAVFRPLSVDPALVLLNQEFQALRSLGFSVLALKDKNSYLLLAREGINTSGILAQIEPLTFGSQVILEMPSISLPTDNRPLPPNAVLYRTHFPVSLLRYLSLIFILFIGFFIYFLIRSARLTGSNLTFSRAGLSILAGINFSMIEMSAVSIFFRILPNPIDSVAAGSLFLLFFAAIGSTAFYRRPAAGILNVTLPILFAFLFILAAYRMIILLLILSVLSISTGTFFPKIFKGDKKTLIFVFVGDSLGSALGMFVTIYLGWTYGAHIFYSVTLAIYLASLFSFSKLKSNGYNEKFHKQANL